MRFVYIYFSIHRKEKSPLTDKFITTISFSTTSKINVAVSRDNLNALAIADEQQRF